MSTTADRTADTILNEMPDWSIYRLVGFYTKSVELSGESSPHAKAAADEVARRTKYALSTHNYFGTWSVRRLLKFIAATAMASDRGLEATEVESAIVEVARRTGDL